ncbi:MAG: hypothetical protein JJU02_14410 [Cryomorphaceae bacterium]|nr:hypothetical protein [Cryomorphaceae bacterium]
MNKCKTVIPFLILIFSFNHLTAQDCNFETDKTDKFSKTRVLYTEPIKINDKKIKLKNVYKINKVEMQLRFENDNYFVNLDFYFKRGVSLANSTSNLIILLTDGSTIELRCTKDIPDFKTGFSSMVYSYNFKLSQEDYNKLLSTDITDFRMTSAINPVEFSVSEKVKTSKIFTCLKNNI